MAAWKRWVVTALIKIFNFIHKTLSYLGWETIPLTVDKILEPLCPGERQEACRQDFMVPMELLLEGYDKAADLNGMQRFLVQTRLRQYAKTRTAVKEEIKKNPDILQTPIDHNGPIVIIGLPRTGTTLLQRLLSCDPRLMSPMAWEMMTPLPPGRPEDWRKCDRYKRAHFVLDLLFPHLPGCQDVLAVHPMGAALPEECFLILERYFMIYGNNISPEFRKFKEFNLNPPQEHAREMYDFYRKCLQCIFYKNLCDGKTILLKGPIHLLYLDFYREAMPNAKFIFTYRDASDMAASLCSLFEKSGKVVQQLNYIDRKYIGEMCLDFYRCASARGIRTFKDIPEGSLVCLPYSELIAEPLGALKKIYTQFDMDLTPKVTDAMQRYLVENKLHKKHIYGSISDYGITELDIQEAMPDFFEYFKNSPQAVF